MAVNAVLPANWRRGVIWGVGLLGLVLLLVDHWAHMLGLLPYLLLLACPLMHVFMGHGHHHHHAGRPAGDQERPSSTNQAQG
jgi:hypothetical protein